MSTIRPTPRRFAFSSLRTLLVATLAMGALGGAACDKEKASATGAAASDKTEASPPMNEPTGLALSAAAIHLGGAKDGARALTMTADGELQVDGRIIATLSDRGEVTVDGEVVAQMSPAGEVTFPKSPGKSMLIAEDGALVHEGKTMIRWEHDGTLAGEVTKDLDGVTAKLDGPASMRRPMSLAFLVTLLTRGETSTAEAPTPAAAVAPAPTPG